MTASTLSKLGSIAKQRWGMFTTSQASRLGVSRNQLTRLTHSGALVRVMQGVYRIAGAPEPEHERIYATWLALGGAAGRADGTTVPPVVAGGVTAALLHGFGDFYPEGIDFIVPTRKGTRHPGVRLRVLDLSVEDVTWVDGISALTVENTIADLVGLWVDRSLIGDALGEAIRRGALTSPSRLARLLAPIAAHYGHLRGDGQALAADLYEIAGAQPT